MKNFILIGVLLLVALPGSWVSADERNSAWLVGRYVAALKSGDQQDLAAVWQAINVSPDAKAWMKQNNPKAAYAYKLTGMALRLEKLLEDFRKNYADALDSPPPPPLPVMETRQDYNQVPQYNLMDNGTAARLYPNQDQRPNKVGMDNGTSALLYPNQNEMTNQELIKRRRQYMGLE